MVRPKKVISNNRWTNANMERINIAVHKGQKQLIIDKAQSIGLSTNAYINQLIDADLNTDDHKQNE